MFTGSFDSWQPLRVCKLSAIALLLHTCIIVKNENIILYLYIYVFLIVHQDTAVVYNSQVTVSFSYVDNHDMNHTSFIFVLTFSLQLSLLFIILVRSSRRYPVFAQRKYTLVFAGWQALVCLWENILLVLLGCFVI